MAKPELRPLGWEDEEPFPDTIAALKAWIKPDGYDVAVLSTTTDEYLPARRKNCRERLEAMNLKIAAWLMWKGIAERPAWFGAACGNPAERLLAWHAWLSTLATPEPGADAALEVDLTSVQDAVYRVLTDEYQSAADIAAAAVVSDVAVRRELPNLKRMGLVDHKTRVGYRRKCAHTVRTNLK